MRRQLPATVRGGNPPKSLSERMTGAHTGTTDEERACRDAVIQHLVTAPIKAICVKEKTRVDETQVADRR